MAVNGALAAGYGQVVFTLAGVAAVPPPRALLTPAPLLTPHPIVQPSPGNQILAMKAVVFSREPPIHG